MLKFVPILLLAVAATGAGVLSVKSNNSRAVAQEQAQPAEALSQPVVDQPLQAGGGGGTLRATWTVTSGTSSLNGASFTLNWDGNKWAGSATYFGKTNITASVSLQSDACYPGLFITNSSGLNVASVNWLTGGKLGQVSTNPLRVVWTGIAAGSPPATLNLTIE